MFSFVSLPGSNYVINPLPNMNCGDVCNMICCCQKNLQYMNVKNLSDRIAYHNSCALCSTYSAGVSNGPGVLDFDWKYSYRPRGCCDNGCFFCMCPDLHCSGRIKEGAIIDTSTRQEVFTLQRSLCPCWQMACFCAHCPCNYPLRDCASCCAFCSGNFFMDLITPVYGPFIDIQTKTPPVGHVIQTIVNVPRTDSVAFCFTCCCASKVATLSTRYMPAAGESVTKEQGLAIGLLLMHYKDNSIVDMMMVRPPVPQARGCSCLDSGLDSEVHYKGVMDAVRDGTVSF